MFPDGTKLFNIITYVEYVCIQYDIDFYGQTSGNCHSMFLNVSFFTSVDHAKQHFPKFI